MKIGFFENEPWEVDYLKSKLSEHNLSFYTSPLTESADLKETDYDIIGIFVWSKINDKVLSRFPNLKLITTLSTGFDHIDLKATAERGITTSNVPTYGENTVAEFAFALMLSVSRRIIPSVKKVCNQHIFKPEGLQGMDLKGKILGVVGTGHIGQHVIKIAHGFGMDVVAFDAFPQPQLQDKLDFKYVELSELLQSSDVITLHVPYLPSTHHLINMDTIQKIKKGAILINTSRGPVVENKALIKGLEDGTLRGAGLDVMEGEDYLKEMDDFTIPNAPNTLTPQAQEIVKSCQELINHPNVVMTPHNAFNTREARTRILDTTIENINMFIKNSPQNVVKV